MISLQQITYIHPNKELLFDQISLHIQQQQKIALIGNNGVGKSTLLKLIAGKIQPSAGQVHVDAKCYDVPQHYGQYNTSTVAEALGISAKLQAFYEILDGRMTDEHLQILDDDWSIEERCQKAFQYWGIEDIDLQQSMSRLSGGQKTKVFLSGIMIHEPDVVLMDEPSNHLDRIGRTKLYEFITQTNLTLLIVSHDRQLLNLLNTVYELSPKGIRIYGGNYDHYVEQKKIESEALEQDIRSKEKALRKAKEVERETLERQQKLDARGKKKQEKAGLPTIVMNTLRNSAERSTAKIKDVHAEKLSHITNDLDMLRKEVSDTDRMKFGFDQSSLHKGKVLVEAKDINYTYAQSAIWENNVSFKIFSGDRYAIKGVNGSGKTTLINMILGNLSPGKGNLFSAIRHAVYIDQDYSLINGDLTVFEQASHFNSSALQEHEIKIRLVRFLFDRDTWDNPCYALSGGEKMRLMLCCLTIGNQAPDIIILDEPTNNLDIQNMEILTSAINDYKGTLLAISHDEYFLSQIHIEQTIQL